MKWLILILIIANQVGADDTDGDDSADREICAHAVRFCFDKCHNVTSSVIVNKWVKRRKKPMIIKNNNHEEKEKCFEDCYRDKKYKELDCEERFYKKVIHGHG